MSTTNQNSSKKINGSGNNSTANTPTSTPIATVTNVSNSHTPVQSITPPNNAPKYGTLVPNRVFVGGISSNTTEAELLQLFSNYGTVKAAKIILDRAGVSKGYGFITFESEEEARRLQREGENIVLRERKLNIAPAIKKQPFSRAFDASSPPVVTPGGPTQYFIPANSVPFYQGGVAYYPQPAAPPADPNAQQAPVYQPPTVYPAQSGPPQTATYPSVMFPAPPVYMPQQYPYQPVPYDYNYYTNNGPQYVVGGQSGPQPQGPPLQPPGSPPRPQCYTQQQLSFSTDAMYYSMPIYGAIEGPTAAMYQDSVETANGNIIDDTYSPPGQEVEGALQEPSPEQTSLPPSIPSQSDTTRQSNTPVVSLLSLDQHQEKDFTSLQGGRRRKSTGSGSMVNVTSPYHSNGYTAAANFVNQVTSVPNHHLINSFSTPPNSINSFHNSSIPPVPGNVFNGPVPFVSNAGDYPYMPRYPGGGNVNRNVPASTAVNGNDRSFTWAQKRYKNRDKRNSSEPSQNASSQRTESNSSASIIDENRNEDKSRRTNVDSPSPAPYSPIVQQGFGMGKYYSRNFHSQSRGARNSFSSLDSGRNSLSSSNRTQKNSSNYRRYSTGNARYVSSRPPYHEIFNRVENSRSHNNSGSSARNSVEHNKKDAVSHTFNSNAFSVSSISLKPSQNLPTNVNNGGSSSGSNEANATSSKISQTESTSSDSNCNINHNSNNSSISNADTETNHNANPGTPATVNTFGNSNPSPNLSVSSSQIPSSVSQHFVPPVRRPRRSIRRSAQAAASLNEIGAGDAPLPSADVSDACKKLDNLKL